jgi:eukaryotic-like serine/threonine-protein kinase
MKALNEMTTTPAASRWARIKELFEAVVELPAAQRDAAMAGAGLEADSEAELRSLLAHHDQATGSGSGNSFMALSAASHLSGEASEEASPSAARIGQRLGAWEIVHPVGSGGMGEVFEARRADGQFEGRAAVKLLKRGMDSAAVLQRFASERQALARLSHPHIASLFDAGASDEGLPYFVLEFVDGQPIDAAVRGMPLDARLRLFLQLADAVAHAHRNLLVHRDLKPGNVSVNTEGQVKLLDFGIAKALDPLEGNDGNTTVGGQRPYTPNYASPEQVRGEPVSTATDIYSLGVLLYQMLTGTRPTGRHATTPMEAARCVLEDQPTKPSRLTADEAVDPQWLSTRKKLEGDLDNILLKALVKQPTERYASVDAMASDINAYLEGRPVSARAASRRYLLTKFVRRNRAVVTASAAAALALVLGLFGTAWQAHRAGLALESASTRLAQTRSIARDLVMRYADTVMYLPGGMKMQVDMLTDTVGHLDKLGVDASADPAFAGDVATAYARLVTLQVDNLAASLTDAPAGSRNLARALELFPIGAPAHQNDVEYSVWWARALQAQFNLRRSSGDLPGAMAACEKRVELMNASLERFPGNLAARDELGSAWFCIGQLNYSMVVPSLKRPAEAFRALSTSEDIYLALARDEPSEYGYPHQLGTIAGARMLILQAQDRVDEAVAQGRRAVSFKQAALKLAPVNVGVRNTVGLENSNFGNLLLEAGLAEEALSATTRSQDALRALVRDDPSVPRWASSRRLFAMHHGRALLAAGRPTEALAPLRESIAEMASAAKGGTVRRRGWARLALAQALVAAQYPSAASTELEAALQDLATFLKDTPADVDALVFQAQALHLRADLQGRPAAARRADLALARASFDSAMSVRPLRAHQERARQGLLAAIAGVY